MKNLPSIWNLLYNGGLTAAEFRSVKPLMDESNHKIWRVLSALLSLYFFIAMVSALAVSSVQGNFMAYLMMAAFSLFCTLAFFTFARPGTPALGVCIHVMCAVTLAFGIYIGVIRDAYLLAVTFHVMLMAIPLVVIDRPYRICITNIIFALLFIACVCVTKTGEVRSLDIYNAVCFSLLGQVINVYMVHNRMTTFLMARKIEVSSLTDELTGLPNRRAAGQGMNACMEKIPSDRLVIASLDVNGLKNVNDTLGHEAGDELLVGAAECMNAVFSKAGTVYRVGGDEFTAILSVTDSQLGLLRTELENTVSAWRGGLVQELSLSCGFAAWKNHPDATAYDLMRIADMAMYEEKAAYYRNRGNDRRGREADPEKKFM